MLQHLNPPQPLSSVGQYTFDGQGNFTRVDFNVGNGVPVNNASTPVNDSGFRTGQTVHTQSARTALAKLP